MPIRSCCHYFTSILDYEHCLIIFKILILINQYKFYSSFHRLCANGTLNSQVDKIHLTYLTTYVPVCMARIINLCEVKIKVNPNTSTCIIKSNQIRIEKECALPVLYWSLEIWIILTFFTCKKENNIHVLQINSIVH